jgi:FdhD protein
MMEPASKIVPVLKLSDGRFTPSETSIVVEKELPVIVNGEHLAIASLTPSMEREFVAGISSGRDLSKAPERSPGWYHRPGRRRCPGTADILSSRRMKTTYRIVSGGGRTAYFEASACHALRPTSASRKKIFFGP